MIHCLIRRLVVNRCAAIGLAALILNGTALASPQRTLQEAKTGPCGVAFMVKMSAVMKSDLARRSGILPNSQSQPEMKLLAEAESVRGVCSLPDDLSNLFGAGRGFKNFYIEVLLKSDSLKSEYYKHLESQVEKDPNLKRLKEENGAVFFGAQAPAEANAKPRSPAVFAYQIVFDDKRITFLSQPFEYDPAKLPAVTEPVRQRLENLSGTAGYVVMDLKSASQLIESGLKESLKNAPPLVPYLEMLQRMNWMAASVELDDTALIKVKAECARSQDAEQLVGMLEDLIAMAKNFNQAPGPAADVYAKILESVKVNARGREVVVAVEVSETAATKFRKATDDIQLTNHQRQAALCMHNFESACGRLPFHAVEGESDELSWRVRILPYLDQQSLYERFELNQSWDSAKNLGILETTPMPAVFGGANASSDEMATKTNLCWVKSNVKSLTDLKRGASNTICFVHSDKFVNWTENNDVTAQDVMAQFKALKPGQTLTATFYDGSVRRIAAEMDPEEFARMLDPGTND